MVVLVQRTIVSARKVTQELTADSVRTLSHNYQLNCSTFTITLITCVRLECVYGRPIRQKIEISIKLSDLILSATIPETN